MSYGDDIFSNGTQRFWFCMSLVLCLALLIIGGFVAGILATYWADTICPISITTTVQR